MPRRDQLFETITTEGALLPSDFLQRLAQRDPEIKGLTPDDYHLGGGEKINEAISRSWNRMLGVWKAFSAAADALPASEPGTTLTRDKWLRPLFQELGYGWLATAKPFEFEDRKYAISHGWQATPIHLVSFRVDLDERSEIVGARRSTPHSLVQDFLNRSDAHLWAIVSSGYKLRLLRDNASLTRQAYVEFDLQSMMQGEVYADFALLWLLLHQSRVEAERPELCWLEKWTQEARQQGERFLDHMRVGVEKAIETLGQGFLAHPANKDLRQLLRDGQLSTLDYYKQILRVVYRFIFLFIAEDRDLLHVPANTSTPDEEQQAAVSAKAHYFRHYSATRLRRIAQRVGGTQHSDLWQIVQLVARSLGSKEGCPALGLPALGSFLWSSRTAPALEGCQLANRYLLQAIRCLSISQQGRFRRPVDYKNIGSAEFGSVYESLLEQHPKINLEAATFLLDTHAGNERKTTGSHFTPPPLVNCLLDSALEPVLRERGRDFAKLGCKSAEEAILDIKICDKAVGSGHFLIGAAHRIAKRLASIRTGEAEPSPAAQRHALRDVIGRCLYGVDLNPMAVELCKFALWLEALEPGKPLSFLDHHIQCGNSLLGATPALMAQGIPDAAFEPIEGDDKKYCSQFKKANREEVTQLQLLTASDKPWEHLGNLATGIAQIASLPDDRLEDVHAKEQKYAELVKSTGYEFGRQLADAWCAAFVWKKCRPVDGGFDYPITNEVFRRLERNPHDAPKWIRDEIRRLAQEYQFFHWHLSFPDVFQVPPMGQNPDNLLYGWNGGFDVNLGNPPWERVKLAEDEWFAAARPDIAEAPNASKREEMINALAAENPKLHAEFANAQRKSDGESQFVRSSGLYPLCGRGDINTYSIFAELNRNSVSLRGRVGLVLQAGIATDKTTSQFFEDLVATSSIVSLYSFDNQEGMFPSVKRSMRFCLMTLTGHGAPFRESIRFVFYAKKLEQINDPARSFTLTAKDIELLNPNTRTCPVFQSRRDCDLVTAIYRRIPVLVNHRLQVNQWDLTIRRVLDMNKREVLGLCTTESPVGTDSDLLPVCEAKLIGQLNHRAATYEGGKVREALRRDLCDASFKTLPRYWISQEDVATRLVEYWKQDWLLVWQDVTDVNTMSRTVSAALIPFWGTDFTLRVGFPERNPILCALAFVANFNSFVFDYISRQKIGGTHLSDYILKQLPILLPATYTQPCLWASEAQLLKTWLLPRVLELTYTAWDLWSFARDCGYDGPPFRWDEARRFLLRCELDAAFFHLYGIKRDDADYIMGTFPIVKRQDDEKFGDYRTKLVILKLYDAIQSAKECGRPYQTVLDPPPADPRCCHPQKQTQ